MDEIRGRIVEMYVSLKPGVPGRGHGGQGHEAIEVEIGKIARPKNVWIVSDMPKTRSGKIMRRVIASVSNFARRRRRDHSGQPGGRRYDPPPRAEHQGRQGRAAARAERSRVRGDRQVRGGRSAGGAVRAEASASTRGHVGAACPRPGRAEWGELGTASAGRRAAGILLPPFGRALRYHRDAQALRFRRTLVEVARCPSCVGPQLVAQHRPAAMDPRHHGAERGSHEARRSRCTGSLRHRRGKSPP